ncbi:MAG TPA: CCA tRNA nucleotidyltransferase [Sphingobium sp.]
MTAPTLPDAPWRHRPGLDRLLDALGARDGAARFVGGAVRDTLLALPVEDIDIATIHEPDEIIARIEAAGIKAVPTGIAHGTVTAVIEGKPAEVTTLRRDVSTDGRRATVAFTTQWREDAARRDFTINALYADPVSGAISDYFGGVADLTTRHVRFIGKAEDRIAEDHLRILRYFRFLARFGGGTPDAEAYAACVAQANSLMALSRERIAYELLKLLATADPAPAIALMVAGGILAPVLPEVTKASVARLASLVEREKRAGVDGSALRRLCALLPADATAGETVAARLKLSNRARKRIALALSSEGTGAGTVEALAYAIGVEGAIDRILLDETATPGSMILLNGWERPVLGATGGHLIARGMFAGPDIAKALKMIEDQWIAEDFPGQDRVDEIVDQTVSKFQRARQ